jgi:hypothetical protein
MPNRCELFAIAIASGKAVKNFVDAGNGGGDGGPANSKRFRHEMPLSNDSPFVRLG